MLKVKVHTLDIAPLCSESPCTAEALRYGTCSQGISQFYLHTHTFIRNRNEPYLPLPSQPQLELIFRPQKNGRLSRPWCKVAPAEIRTCNLPIANSALYHTATSAPNINGKCHFHAYMCLLYAALRTKHLSSSNSCYCISPLAIYTVAVAHYVCYFVHSPSFYLSISLQLSPVRAPRL